MLPDVVYLGEDRLEDNVYATKNDLNLAVANEDQTKNNDLQIILNEHTAFQLISDQPVALFGEGNYYEVKTRAMGSEFTEKYNLDNNYKFYINEADLQQRTTRSISTYSC